MQKDDPFSYRLPKRINEPLTLIIWPIHYVLVPLMCIGFGIIIDKSFELIIVGVVWFFVLKYVETRYPKGFLNHFLYWKGLSFYMPESKYTPNSFKREFYQ